MQKTYRIYPGIGIARVGQSEDGFFLQSETLDGEPFEINLNGKTGFKGYKDSSFLVRKQGIRFRVFEFEKDEEAKEERLIREITANEAKLTWRVELGNSKAAGPEIGSATWGEAEGGQEERVQEPKMNLRNRGIARADLQTKASVQTEGINTAVKLLEGRIMNKNFLLGSVQTDNLGRLIVLGGTGEAGSWETPPPPILEFNNNDGWYDTVADGSVDVDIEFNDGTMVNDVSGSWVIIGPPDFAPAVLPIVSLYDLMFDVLVRAGRISAPQSVSFKGHVLPLLERIASTRWTNQNEVWDEFNRQLNDPAMADPTGDVEVRRSFFSLLIEGVELSNFLQDFRTTRTQKRILSRWVEGDFSNNEQELHATKPITEVLNEATLRRSIGSGLFPGIEMGFFATNPLLYEEPFRFTRKPFDSNGQMVTLTPGIATQGMALPWQADFMECNTNWWPAQRPDVSKADASGNAALIPWDRGLVVGKPDTPESHLNMVEHYAQLGVIEQVVVAGNKIMVEKGRDPQLSS